MLLIGFNDPPPNAAGVTIMSVCLLFSMTVFEVCVMQGGRSDPLILPEMIFYERGTKRSPLIWVTSSLEMQALADTFCDCLLVSLLGSGSLLSERKGYSPTRVLRCLSVYRWQRLSLVHLTGASATNDMKMQGRSLFCSQRSTRRKLRDDSMAADKYLGIHDQPGIQPAFDLLQEQGAGVISQSYMTRRAHYQ